MRSVHIILVLLLTAPAAATSFIEPVRRDVPSLNGAFVLDVDPRSGIHAMYAANDRNTLLWSFSKRESFGELLVSDDGRVVAWLPWRYTTADEIHDGIGIEFRSAAGLFMIQGLARLCPHPERTTHGPIGPWWRTWLNGVEERGATFVVTTTCGEILEFRYEDGALVDRSMTPERRLSLALRGVLAIGVAALVLAWRIRVLREPPALSRSGAVLHA